MVGWAPGLCTRSCAVQAIQRCTLFKCVPRPTECTETGDSLVPAVLRVAPFLPASYCTKRTNTRVQTADVSKLLLGRFVCSESTRQLGGHPLPSPQDARRDLHSHNSNNHVAESAARTCGLWRACHLNGIWLRTSVEELNSNLCGSRYKQVTVCCPRVSVCDSSLP